MHLLNSVIVASILACIPMISQAQTTGSIPRDTTYNIYTAYSKIRKIYPYAEPVKKVHYSVIPVDSGIVYRTIESRKLHMDIYKPSASEEEKLTGILCIHGGGWASGDRSLLAPLAMELANQGYIAATVEYRLSPEALYPAGIIDVKSAITWLKENAGTYKLDTNHIVILGTSAGATIASLVGNTPCHPLYQIPEGDTLNISDQVRAIINIDGILDFTDPAESGKDLNPEKPSAAARWLGATYAEDPDLWIEASPLTYAGRHTPPTLFINSSIPRFHAGRDDYISIVSAFGIRTFICTIPDSPHSFWLFNPWFDRTVEEILKFLKTVL